MSEIKKHRTKYTDEQKEYVKILVEKYSDVHGTNRELFKAVADELSHKYGINPLPVTLEQSYKRWTGKTSPRSKGVKPIQGDVKFCILVRAEIGWTPHFCLNLVDVEQTVQRIVKDHGGVVPSYKVLGEKHFEVTVKMVDA